MLQLLVLPLEIAARHRDKNSLWELPLAGQMLSVAMIIGIAVPILFAPVLDTFLNQIFTDTGVQIVALLLHLLSMVALAPGLLREHSEVIDEEMPRSSSSLIIS